jgi:thioredoxin reductase (NADPH)
MASTQAPSRAAVEAAARAIMHGRFDQAFPTLTTGEIARMRRFGEVMRFADREALFEAGKPRVGMFVVLTGTVALTARDGLGHVTPLLDQGPGQFIAEVASLADDATAIVDGHADGEVEVLFIPSERMRSLIVADAELGERITRALVLRRVALIELGQGPLVIGNATSRDVVRIENFLRRNGHPFRLLDPSADKAAAGVLAQKSPEASELPLVIVPTGQVLRNPSEATLAHALGILSDRFLRSDYDVAIVGCGPAGLSAAVSAASEGLSVIVLDAQAFGGQAGASARIENYFGFPSGISGLALTARAYVQARKFGAEIAIPVEVVGLERNDDGSFNLLLDDGRRLRARAVVVASGARYRRPAIENLATFEGRGVWYWASPLEAKLCARQEIIIVGGGNSAGQAAVFLAEHASYVRIMIRGRGLGSSMSRYLIERIAAIPNIEVLTETEIVALEGSPERGLERVRWRSRRAPTETTKPIANVFIFIGADPSTKWLSGCGVALDSNGFVMTGGASPLASSVPGIFAVGDVRSGSVKRVSSAIGEGAQVVSAVYSFLSARPQRTSGPFVSV